MRGYVAVTDYGWYDFLRGQPHLDEVNFWQPSGGGKGFQVVPPGSPFFFKLKAPHNAVAGYGILARHDSMVPDWLAWDAFGIANGAPDLEALRRCLSRNRAKAEPDRTAIGCLMITQPVFFPESEWVRQPRDWKPNIVQGKGYDLSAGEGEILWQACLARTGGAQRELVIGESTPRFGAPQLIQPRLGQGTFRLAVTQAYGRACAVTGEHSLPVLEAAHILAYKEGGAHRTSNGLLLRTDIHRLYDKHYVSVTPDLEFKVGDRLREEWNNGKIYYELGGRRLQEPRDPADRPDRELLARHYEEFRRVG